MNGRPYDQMNINCIQEHLISWSVCLILIPDGDIDTYYKMQVKVCGTLDSDVPLIYHQDGQLAWDLHHKNYHGRTIELKLIFRHL